MESQSSSAEGPESESCSTEKYDAGIPSTKTLTETVPEIPEESVQQDHIYRARGLPGNFNRQDTVNLILTLFKLESNNSPPRIRSLAKTHDGRMMVATLSFRISPAELSGRDSNEWSFDITNFLHELRAEDEDNRSMRQSRTLTIDDHFRGLTVLSYPSPSDHMVE